MAHSAQRKKNPNKSICEYVLHFREQILNIFPRVTPQTKLIQLYWNGIPKNGKPASNYPPPLIDLYHFILSTVHAERYAIPPLESARSAKDEATTKEDEEEEEEKEEDLSEDEADYEN